MNNYAQEFETAYNALIENTTQDKSMQILIKGQLDTVLRYYERAALSVLADMYYALPSNNEDWMSDELREAKDAASKLV